MLKNLIYRNKIEKDSGNTIDIDKSVKMRNIRIKIRGKNNILKIEKNVNLNGVNIEIRGENCKIEIGEGTIIGKDTYISSREKNISIIIGKECMFSRNIKLMTSDGHPIFQENKRINLARDIIIEDGVWLADNVTILKGVVVKKGCVIGINSTITNSVEKSNVVIVGNPGRVVRENIEWKDELN